MSQMKVLQDIRVVDVSPYLPSNYCSLQLAQLGAEVILVERPGPRQDVFPGLFELVNYNKKSLQLDLKSDQGKEIFHRLAASSDVIIEGFRPGVASRLKIGYEDIRSINPDIIYCSISGFGQDGPYRDKPGHDVNYLGLSGYFSVPGQIGTPPSRPGIPVVDLCAGMLATTSVLAGLMARERSGEGQYIDIAMLDAITAWTSTRAGAYMVKKETITDEHIIATSDVYQTRDGKSVVLGIVGEEHFWRNFCEAAGHKILVEDSRFATEKSRFQNREALSGILRDIFQEKTREEWLQLFRNTDVPLSPASTMEEALSDPQITHRGLLNKITDPEWEEISVAGFPAKFSSISTEIYSPPPRIGQHTREILEQLGYSEEIIATLE
jgi:crotonobetainyl-CoA:carnitine CoA-transferase CaiB-like acyl-CoA transferase